MVAQRVRHTSDEKLFSKNFLEGHEIVSCGNWIVERFGYAHALKSNSMLLCINQNHYFANLMRHKSISSIPETMRIEVSPIKVINIGYKLDLGKTIQMLCDEQAWSVVRQAFESAAMALVDLHDKPQLYQGGLSLESIGFSGGDRSVKFLNWSHSCSETGMVSRLHNPSKYYFQQNRK